MDLFGVVLPAMPREPVRPVAYAKLSQPPSAAPILTAVGGTVLGIGLALGSGGGTLDPLPLIPGALILVAAVLSAISRRRTTGVPPPSPPGGQ